MSKLEKESEKAKARLEIDGVIVDCWSALILVSQGRCLGKPASFLLFQLPSLSNSWPNLATWTHFSIFFFTSCQPFLLYSSQSKSLSSYLLSVVLLRPRPTEHLPFFPSLSSNESGFMQRAVDWKRAAGDGWERNQPAGQRWVCSRTGGRREGPVQNCFLLFKPAPQQ